MSIFNTGSKARSERRGRAFSSSMGGGGGSFGRKEGEREAVE